MTFLTNEEEQLIKDLDKTMVNYMSKDKQVISYTMPADQAIQLMNLIQKMRKIINALMDRLEDAIEEIEFTESIERMD